MNWIRTQLSSFRRVMRSWFMIVGWRPMRSRLPFLDTTRIRVDDHRLLLCLKELDQLHAIITWYDEAVLRKKSWCIAVWSIISAFGIHSVNATVVLLGLVAVMGFATSELILRRYQRRYIVRAEEIDGLLAGGDLSHYRYALTDTAGRSERRREIWYALTQPHFTLYYGFFGANSVGCAMYLGL